LDSNPIKREHERERRRRKRWAAGRLVRPAVTPLPAGDARGGEIERGCIQERKREEESREIEMVRWWREKIGRGLRLAWRRGCTIAGGGLLIGQSKRRR